MTDADFHSLFLQILRHIQAIKPWVMYSLPDSEEIKIGMAEALHEVFHDEFLISSKNGFLLHPFDTSQSHRRYIIPFETTTASFHLSAFTTFLNKYQEDDDGKQTLKTLSKEIMQSHHYTGKSTYNYEVAVQNGIDKMQQGDFEKVVLCLSDHMLLNDQFNVMKTFLNLRLKYPETFVSLHFSAPFGWWIGASPEILLTVDEQQNFETVALAGTQVIEENQDLMTVGWTQKEIEEQAMVTRYIINCFKKVRVRKFKEEGPKTIKTGKLAHLQTRFYANLDQLNFPELGDHMLRLLHPTSAVCGMPIEEAKTFIKNVEKRDRSLFAGVIGPIGIKNKTNLFVNLRCGKFENNGITCFAGAGLTQHSNPKLEKIEIQNKIKAIKEVIQT